MLKKFNAAGMFFMMVAIIFLYHQQLAGHPKERLQCNKIGGILWHTLNGD